MARCPREFRGCLKQGVANPKCPAPQHTVPGTFILPLGNPGFHTSPTPLPRDQFVTCRGRSHGDKLAFHSLARIQQEWKEKAATFISTSLMLLSLEREWSAAPAGDLPTRAATSIAEQR